MIRFKLHAVWWVVSPGNPLKTKDASGDLSARMDDVRQFIKGRPRMLATDIEAQLATRYTYDTLKKLKKHFPTTAFVWIAGMDNACSFDRWDRWQDLPQVVPFTFFDRPPASNKIRGKKLRQNKRIRQRTKNIGAALKPAKNGVFWILDGKTINLSSTSIRAKKP
jgi:nicotinate-nucleotide adenylyltransferase